MKKLFFLTFFIFFINAITFAQQKKYISYTIKKGENIKSIAKRYHLSFRDLLRLNPGVRRKPKPNTVIIIPNINYGKVISETKKPFENSNLYRVKRKETLFGISKKFGITIEALKKANPGLIYGMKIGMQLVIPKSTRTIEIDSINFVIHKVVKDDTFYNLTKKYQVTQESLEVLNPQLSEGLKLGMILKIKPKNNLEEVVKFNENLNLDKELKVYFMLPYQLNKLTDSLEEVGFGKSNSLLNIVTDFHLGASMAIDSLRTKGLKINVQFIDTENSKFKLQYITNKYNFNSNDIIIGPMFYDKAYWLANHVNSYVVAPFYSKKQDSLSTENLIKSSPSIKVYEDKLLSYMKKTYNGENIIVINDEKLKNQSRLWRIVNKLKTFDSIHNIGVVKPKESYIDGEIFKKKLDTLGKNWVFLISDDVITTSATVNNLKTYAEYVDVKLFSIFKGRNFDNISNSFLGKLNFVFPSSEYMNIEDFKTQRFYKKFKSKNYALPSKYAIKGFDVTYDILARMASSNTLKDGLQAGESVRINTSFYFTKNNSKGLENEAVHIVQLNKELKPVILEF